MTLNRPDVTTFNENGPFTHWGPYFGAVSVVIAREWFEQHVPDCYAIEAQYEHLTLVYRKQPDGTISEAVIPKPSAKGQWVALKVEHTGDLVFPYRVEGWNFKTREPEPFFWRVPKVDGYLFDRCGEFSEIAVARALGLALQGLNPDRKT